MELLLGPVIKVNYQLATNPLHYACYMFQVAVTRLSLDVSLFPIIPDLHNLACTDELSLIKLVKHRTLALYRWHKFAVQLLRRGSNRLVFQGLLHPFLYSGSRLRWFTPPLQ